MSSRSYLIVTASIGSGHMKAAQALAAALLDEEPQARVTVVDFTRRDMRLCGKWQAFIRSAG